MEPAQRSPGSGARLPAPVSARHVRKRRAGAGSVVDRDTVKRRPRRPLRRCGTAVIVLLVTLRWSSAAADTTTAAETVIVLQPTTASPAVRRSLARIRDELAADRFRVVVADAST